MNNTADCVLLGGSALGCIYKCVYFLHEIIKFIRCCLFHLKKCRVNKAFTYLFIKCKIESIYNYNLVFYANYLLLITILTTINIITVVIILLLLQLFNRISGKFFTVYSTYYYLHKN